MSLTGFGEAVLQFLVDLRDLRAHLAANGLVCLGRLCSKSLELLALVDQLARQVLDPRFVPEA